MSGGIGELVAAFNGANPGFSLVATPLDHESFKTSLVDSLETGSPPDIYSYWAGAKTAAIASRLEPLDDIWTAGKLDSVFPAALRDAASAYDGRLYLLPITQHLVGFFYSKETFAKAGVVPPADWPSFLAACARLKAAGTTPVALGAKDRWPAQFWFDYLLLRTAGKDYRDALLAGGASWTDPEVRRAFSLWKTLIEAGYMNERPNEAAWDEGAGRMVLEGKAAMTLMGSWMMGSWASMAPAWTAGTDYGFFPFPAVDRTIRSCALGPVDRSEERRVGKECRSGWSPDH